MNPAIVIWLCMGAGIFLIWAGLDLRRAHDGAPLGHWLKRLPRGLLLYGLLWPVMALVVVIQIATRWWHGARNEP